MRFTRPLPSVADLLSKVAYDPLTGVFIYTTPGEPRGRPRADSVVAKVAHKPGAIIIRLFGRSWYAHRIAWKIHYGVDPEGDIDHINGDPTDNRIANLRVSTPSQNLSNRGKTRVNTSGYKGVSWNKKARRWTASIRANKTSRSLGFFTTAEEAYAAYCQAAIELHGEYARIK